MRVISSFGAPVSPARVCGSGSGQTPERLFRLGAVQVNWLEEPRAHRAQLREGVLRACEAGAALVVLPELTLSPYFACSLPSDAPDRLAEDLETGETISFCRALAQETGVPIHASLFEKAQAPDGLGFNTAVVVAPDGATIARTRKLHIPVTAGYYEDRYFRPGPAENAFPVHEIGEARFGFPTCWDQWFPELARAYGLQGADILVYPTAIGSEPDHPGFDTAPLWRSVMVGHAIANGLFIAAVNRFGEEGGLCFYGQSFIADPYGRVLVEAPRDACAVLVADLDLDQRRDWLALFPFFRTRRPELYEGLAEKA